MFVYNQKKNNDNKYYYNLQMLFVKNNIITVIYIFKVTEKYRP